MFFQLLVEVIDFIFRVLCGNPARLQQILQADIGFIVAVGCGDTIIDRSILPHAVAFSPLPHVMQILIQCIVVEFLGVGGKWRFGLVHAGEG